MKGKHLTLSSLIAVFFLILLSFFLNYLSSSYTEIDLFKLDLVQKKRPKTTRKLVFILKNSHLLFAVVCFFQVILNMLTSTLLIDGLPFKSIEEKIGIKKYPLLFGITFLMALFTEIISRFLAIRRKNRKTITNPAFVNLTYLILRPFTFLQFLIKPKKKLFSDSEQDIIRFFNNLLTEKTLEEKEIRLVQSALRFDELTVEHSIVPYQKVVFLEETMTLDEVKKIYYQNPFTRYPVLNRKKKVIGILSMKRILWILIRGEQENPWQNQINKKVCFLPSTTKVNQAFEKTQTWNCRMLIVENQKKGSAKIGTKSPPFLGIITLHDILNSLVGKTVHDPEKPFPLLPASKPT